MLIDAEALFTKHHLNHGVNFIHCPVQGLSSHIDKKFDIVLFHAVLEWLVEPRETLKQLLEFIKPGGYLSLMFYSRTGLIYQNLTRGNFDYIINDTLAGKGKSLTPINPQNPDDVYHWLTEFELDILLKSGVRVFYDGISRERRKQINIDDLLELEQQFSRKEPYCSLARYIHVLCKKK
jgi:S-adenosylmethionine-dependent methyltransferase